MIVVFKEGQLFVAEEVQSILSSYRREFFYLLNTAGFFFYFF